MKKILKLNLKNYFTLCLPLAAATILFLIYLPLVQKINFSQNDDLYYYAVVKNFVTGNFILPEKIAPTFYTQGILGGTFALIFGIKHLPVLTLIVSVSCFVLFYAVIRQYLKCSIFKSLILALLLYFNPLFQYSILGFMTENYLLFFVILSLFYYLQYTSTQKNINLYLSIAYWILGFFVKQTALILPLSYITHLLITKNKKAALMQASFFLCILYYYQFFFPQTSEMQEKALSFQHFLKFDYLYAVVYGILLYLSAFLFPLMIFFILKVFTQSKKSAAVWVLITVILYFSLNSLYKPMVVSWGEFPFFENTFERTGFLPRAVNGTKYIFRANYDLYRYWELISKVVLAGFISAVFVTQRVKVFLTDVNFYIIFYFLGIMVAANTFYDRYILFILPSALLLISKEIRTGRNILTWSLCLFYVLFLQYFSYFLSNDYVYGLNYIWNKSQELVNHGVSPSKIFANRAWNLTYGSNINTLEYVFSYDNPKIKSDEIKGFVLKEENVVNFKFSPFISPKIYLYEKN